MATLSYRTWCRRPAFQRGQRQMERRRAVAALEFVLSLPLFLVLLGGLWDFGYAQVCRTSLANAVAAGAVFATYQGTSVVASDIESVVRHASFLPSANLDIAVQGPSTYCFTTATPPELVLQPNTCADGTAPGTYVIITASYQSKELLSGFVTAAAPSMQEQAVVRLQ